MVGAMLQRVLNGIEAAESLYHRLVLLVGPSGAGKTHLIQVVARATCASVMNVNQVVGRELLEVMPARRSLRLQEILDEALDSQLGTVLLDNLEMLFANELHVDPLKMLQSASRRRTIVATWNGAYRGDRLTYAEVGHPEHLSYDSVDAVVICMGTADQLHVDADQGTL